MRGRSPLTEHEVPLCAAEQHEPSRPGSVDRRGFRMFDVWQARMMEVHSGGAVVCSRGLSSHRFGEDVDRSRRGKGFVWSQVRVARPWWVSAQMRLSRGWSG